MKPEYKGTLAVDGKTYKVEVIDGIRYIDGKTVDMFLLTLPFDALIDMAVVGVQATKDKISSTKEQSYQDIANKESGKRNN